MSIYNKLFGNFSGGEITPRMHMHRDLDYFKNSASIIENFKLTTQGNVKKRFGSNIIFSNTSITTDDIKLVVFGDCCYAFYKTSLTTLNYIYYNFDNELDNGTSSITIGSTARSVIDFDFSISPNDDILYIITGGIPVKVLKQPTSNLLSSTLMAHSFDSYPTVSTFYQGRLWLAGFSGKANRILGSGSGNYDDFTVPAPGLINDSSPLDFEIDRTGDIKFLLGGKALHCGHEQGINSINASTIITTANAFLTRQTRIPIGRVSPIEYNSGFLFSPVSSDGLYFSKYSREAQSWSTTLLSNKANHITNGIKEIHGYHDGSEKLCCLMNDGTQSHYTIADSKVTGGWVHYSGVNVLTTCYDNRNLANQYSIVKVNSKIYLVKISDDYLDCAISKILTGSDNTIITGLEIYNDTTVVVKNHSIQIFKGLVVNGSINIGNQTGLLSLDIGYGYDSKLRTLPIIGLDNDNILLDLKKNYEIAVQMGGSFPFINGEDTYKVDPDNLDNILIHGIDDISLQFVGYSKNSFVDIESKHPYELEIYGLSFRGVSNAI